MLRGHRRRRGQRGEGRAAQEAQEQEQQRRRRGQQGELCRRQEVSVNDVLRQRRQGLETPEQGGGDSSRSPESCPSSVTNFPLTQNLSIPGILPGG